MQALGALAREKDALHRASVTQENGAAVEAGRLAGLHSLEHLDGNAIQLAADRNSAFNVRHLEHSWMHVIDREQAIPWGRRAVLEEVSARKMRMEGKPSHQRTVHKELYGHGVTTSTRPDTGAVAASSVGWRTARYPVIAAMST